MDDNNKPTDKPRRRLLKTVAVSGSAVGLSSLPGQWAKPIVASVILPAHAQTSPRGACLGTLDNCPPEHRVSDNQSGSTNKYPGSGGLPPGLSVEDGTLTGSAGTSGYSQGPPCSSPCNDLGANKYYAGTAEAGSGTFAMGYTFEYRCGDDSVARLELEFYGTGIGSGRYAGNYNVSYEGCYYLDGGADTGFMGRGRSRRRGFNFGAGGFNFGG